ncbi:chlorohydrolase [Streptococcus pneumoniae]|nr:hypothetical protein [Streptococcus pneumoniae]CAG6070777.1 chlorohydrolase [Streptococcus pneumoniae]
MGLTKSAQNIVFSKHCFEVVDGTDKVSNHIRQGELTWFEEIFEEY